MQIEGFCKPFHLMITGKKVSAAQAAQIILQTDPSLTSVAPEDADPLLKSYCEIAGIRSVAESKTNWLEDLKRHLETVDLKCLDNAWGYTCCLEGCYGWMHFDGTILLDKDLTKLYPIQFLFDDIQILAKKYPFLEMNITLFDNSCLQEQANVLVSWTIAKGQWKVTTKSVFKLHGRHREHQVTSPSAIQLSACQSLIMPCALSAEQTLELGRYVRKQWSELSLSSKS